MDASDELDAQLADIFADAGCTGWLHAQSLAPQGQTFSFCADSPVVMASVYKLPLAVSLYRMADRGEIDLGDTVQVNPGDGPHGATGLSLFADPVTLSWRDLATSMMTVSDNTAADHILRCVGLDRVRIDLVVLGLSATRIVGGIDDVHAQLRHETGTRTIDEAFAMLADPDLDTPVTAYDAVFASASTPRDCTALLAAIWDDTAASAKACAAIRNMMRAQIFEHRIGSGFPLGRIQVAGKTGTLAVIRNEVAVVEFPGEYPVAVAVFTKSARTDMSLPEVDRAIGYAARTVVTRLRAPTE